MIMKKRTYLWTAALCAAALLFARCAEEQAPVVPEIPAEDAAFAQDKALIASMGFDVAEMRRDNEDGYVVENGIWITEAHLAEYREYAAEAADSLQTRQTMHVDGSGYPLKVSVANQNPIYVYGGTSAVYALEIDAALLAWSTFEYQNKRSNIRIARGAGTSQINLTEERLQKSDLSNDVTTIFKTTPPSGGKPGSIIVNLNYPSHPQSDRTQARYLLMHAIGHALGFNHTPKTYQDSDYSSLNAGLISGSALVDPASIMVKDVAPFAYAGFSEADKFAMGSVYPPQSGGGTTPPGGSVIPSNVVAVLSPSADPITVVVGESRTYSVSSSAPGMYVVGPFISWSGGASFSPSDWAPTTITFDRLGQQTITVRGTLSRYGFVSRSFTPVSFTANVIAPPTPTISGLTNPAEFIDQTYTMNYAPVFGNVQYHWGVSGGQVVSQSGNQAIIRFTELGNQTITGYVTQSSGAGTYTSQTALYGVNVMKMTTNSLLLGFDLSGSTLSCRLRTSDPIPAGTRIEIDFEVLLYDESGNYYERVNFTPYINSGQTTGEYQEWQASEQIERVVIDYSHFFINVDGLIYSNNYYNNVPYRSPKYRFDGRYRYLYQGPGGYYPEEMNFPSGKNGYADL